MTHLEPETLSAYLDAELSSEEAEQARLHLEQCDSCATDIQRMRHAKASVAAIGLESPPAEVSRRVFDAVMSQTQRRRLRWSPAGLVAVTAAAGVIAAAFIVAPRFLGERPQTTGAMSVASLDSPEDVRRAVAEDRAVIEQVGDYRVSDIGNRQEELLSMAAGGVSDEAKRRDAESYTSGPQEEQVSSAEPRASLRLAPAADTGGSARSLSSCLRTVLQSQPYPMLPLSGRAVTYKNQPAFLLVYAFTTETAADARLDRVQIWVVSRSSCSTLHYAFFRP